MSSHFFLVWERFLTCLKNVSQCEVVGLAAGHSENLNLAVLSETSKCGKYCQTLQESTTH